MENEHSLLGASGAKRWLNCAGSFLLAQSLQELGELESHDSVYASEGTKAHTLASMCLEFEREPFEFIGQTLASSSIGVVLEPLPVAIYVNECESFNFRMQGQYLIEGALAFPEVHPLLKGTVDFLWWNPGEILVLRDYKHGAGVPVPVKDNEQLLYYAFLAILNWPEIREHPDMPVNLGIVQPRFDPYDPIKTWETTVGYVIRYGEQVILPRMRELTQAQDISYGDYVSGEWCQFCPVLLECPRAQSAFQNFVATASDLETEMLTNDELSSFFAQRDLAKKFITALDNTVKTRLMAGHEIPSAKLVLPRSRREWKEGASDAIVSEFGEKAYEPRQIKSPAGLEKLGKRGKELAVEWAFMPEGSGFAVASSDDPRPSVKPPAGEETFASFAMEDSGF